MSGIPPNDDGDGPSFTNPPDETPTTDPLPETAPDPVPPDPFLVDITATSASINTHSSAWNAVFADTTLGLKDVTSSGADIEVSSDHFWGLSFSSSANAAILGAGNNSPAVGDSVGSAVLGMLAPTTGPLSMPITFAEVRDIFYITTSNSPQALSDFLDAVDSSGALTITLDTTPGTRNALWAVPGFDPSADLSSTPTSGVYRVVVTLAFDITDAGALKDIESFVNKQYGLNLSLSSLKPQFVVTRITYYTQTPNVQNPNSPGPGLAVSSSYSLTVSVQTATFEVSAIFTPSDLTVFLSNPQNTTPTGSIYDRLSGEAFSSSGTSSSTNPGPTALPNSSSGGVFNTFLSGINLWYVAIGRTITGWSASSGTTPAGPVYGDIYWEIGITGSWRVNSQEILLGVTYDSRSSTFSGQLIFSGQVPTPANKRQWDYMWQTDIPPNPTDQPLPANLDLAQLFEASKPPSQIPTLVTEAIVSYQKGADENSYTFSFAADIKSPTALTPATTTVPSYFDWNEISVNVALQSASGTSSIDIQIYAGFSLNSSTPTYPPANLYVNLEYSTGGNWLLEGHVENLSVGLLYYYFDPGARDSAVGILGGLTLRTMDVLYTFETTGDASSFLITAVLILGELELDLYYQYVSSTAGNQTAASIAWAGGVPNSNVSPQTTTSSTPVWTFEAFLGATSPDSTVGSIAQSISPKAANLPGFIANIAVNTANGGNSPVKVKMQQDATYLVVVIQVLLLDLDFTFVSISPIASGSNTKHILRISVDQIPLINTIPLIKSLPQPFDQLLLLWLDDESGDGLSQDEFTSINKQLQSLNIPLLAVKDNNGAGSGLAVLQPNYHFMVVQKGSVVLDHVFNNTDEQDPTIPSTSPSTTEQMIILDSSSSDDDPAPTSGDLDVQLPFLSISGLTFQFKQASLFIDVDATLVLGPITFDIIGFEIVLHLTKFQLNHLEDMLTDGAITVGIHGLAVSLDETPLELAGIFIHNTTPLKGGGSVEEYIGGISIGFEAWSFLAVGAYEIITDAPTSYKSVFVYAKLDGPLFSIGFATVQGVRVGFGYNSIVRSPTMTELPQFPFLQGDAEEGADGDPINILQAIAGTGSTAWVTPKEDSYWVVAGLTLTAFGILSVTAVLMLGFQQSGVVIAVIADGIAQMPPDSDPDVTLFYVEIYMIAELNTVQGFFTVQAALAPSSHILVPSCRLTGGFALENWFDPNTHSGDFVFTVGGYHPAYSPPSWYPPVDRLGISFTLGSMINVTGTVYFAITPKCVMGGGSLHMGLDVGPVSAWLDVALDVFVQFKPFHYTADLEVSVGCAISINVWFVNVRVTASVGAALHIQGPDPFGGSADVDFYLFSFTIYFGNQSSGPPPLSLGDFYDMVKTPGPAPAQDANSTVTDPNNTLLKFVLSDGLYQPSSAPPSTKFPNTGANTTWATKAGTFQCTITSDFALLSASLVEPPGSSPATTPIYPPNSTSSPPQFYSRPMHINSSNSTITSDLEITVHYYPLSSTTPVVISGFSATMILKPLPSALWSPYDPAADPLAPNSPAAPPALTDPSNPTLSLAAGITLNPPAPQAFQSPILEFDATVAFLYPLGSYPLPPLTGLQNILLASGVVYPTLTPSGRWAQVAADWTNYSEAGQPILGGTITNGVQAPGMLKMAAKVLGWDNPPPSGNTTTATSTGAVNTTVDYFLVGSPPEALIGNLATQFNVLPRYSASGSVPAGNTVSMITKREVERLKDVGKERVEKGRKRRGFMGRCRIC